VRKDVTFFEKKVTEKTLLLGALGRGLPVIATFGGDYRHSRSPRPQEQKFFARFFSKKRFFLPT
jgi:hypothetical protein